MKKIEITSEEIQELIRDYVDNFNSSNILSEKYKIPKKSVLNILRENNIELRKPGRIDLGGKTVADKKYQNKNKEKLSVYYSEWQKNNHIHLKEYRKQWRENNKEHYREVKRNYEKKRKASDPIYKLIGNFRTAIYTVLKESDVEKYDHYFNILGYTQQDLINHLEKQFKDGITWENYGKWHVDHIIPISSFIIKDIYDEEFKRCWDLNNLQPMWGSENIKKYNKIIKKEA